jgi:hypothetical protein
MADLPIASKVDLNHLKVFIGLRTKLSIIRSTKAFRKKTSTEPEAIEPIWANSTGRPGLPDFSWCKLPKLEIYTKMATKYTESQKNRPNGNKIHPTSFIERRSKIYHNLDFLFENIPSGNCENVHQTGRSF